jgi:hypothetical protein
VIDAAVRRAALAMPVAGERVAVFAVDVEGYRALLGERPEVEVRPLAGAPGSVRDYTIAIVEGLDALDDPAGTLRALAIGPGVHIIALVANGAFALALDAFVGGAYGGGHALTEGDIAPLFAAAGLQTHSIAPVYGGTVANPSLPLDIALENLKLRVETSEALTRLQVAGYVVVASAA